MYKRVPFYLLWLSVSACTAVSDKYRDTKHLEFPPTLAVEHTNTTATSSPSVSKTEIASSIDAEKKPEVKAEKPANDNLDELIRLSGSETKPDLELKTRFERAWDLMANGLHLAEIEVVEFNHDQGVFRVNYVADGKGKGRGIFNSISSFLTDKFADTEYTLTLSKDQKTTLVRVDKVTPADKNPGEEGEAYNNDDSASLIKLLRKTIIDDLRK